MSTMTKNRPEDKIRSIIRKLYGKTGLNGAALPIAFNSYGWFLTEAIAAYNADDVAEFDVLAFLNK